MEQHRFIACNLILFALFLTNTAVTATSNAQKSEEILMSTSTVPVPSSGDDFQQMLDYLNKTVPRDGTGSNDNSNSVNDGTMPPGVPSPNQLVGDQYPAGSNGSLHDTSNIHSGKEVEGSYIRAGFSIASAIFAGHFFL
jgi:hypothetical protein